jgi:hypothetical protein
MMKLILATTTALTLLLTSVMVPMVHAHGVKLSNIQRYNSGYGHGIIDSSNLKPYHTCHDHTVAYWDGYQAGYNAGFPILLR